MAYIVADHTLWYSLLGKERLHLRNDGCIRHWARDYVNEWKLGIVIRYEQICLTVDDKQVGSHYLPRTLMGSRVARGAHVCGHGAFVGTLHTCAHYPQCSD